MPEADPKSAEVQRLLRRQRLWTWLTIIGVGITLWSWLCAPVCHAHIYPVLWVPDREWHPVSFCRSETTYVKTETLRMMPRQFLYGSRSTSILDVLLAGPLRVRFFERRPGFGESLGPCLAKLDIKMLDEYREPTFAYRITAPYRYRKPIPRGDSLADGTLWARWAPLRDADGNLPCGTFVDDTGWVLVPLQCIGAAFYRMRAQRPGEADQPRLLPLRPGAPVIDYGR